MNRVKVGFFSMSGGSSFGDDRPYLRWHALDHMPEQYQIAGVLRVPLGTVKSRIARARAQVQERLQQHPDFFPSTREDAHAE